MKILLIVAALLFVTAYGRQHLGCWRDRPHRAINGGIRFRGSVQKCENYARAHGWSVFAVQYGGECFTGPNAHHTFRKYGHARNCRHGRGGGWAQDVYRIRVHHHHHHHHHHGGRRRHLGCWRDRPHRAINGGIRFRGSVQKCENFARSHGWRVFAVQYGGECFTGPNAHHTYRKYGHAHNCRHGRGGGWAQDVYTVGGGGGHARMIRIRKAKASYVRWRNYATAQRKRLHGYNVRYAASSRSVGANARLYNLWQRRANAQAKRANAIARSHRSYVHRYNAAKNACNKRLRSYAAAANAQAKKQRAYVARYKAYRRKAHTYHVRYIRARKVQHSRAVARNKAIRKYNAYVKKQNAAVKYYRRVRG